MEIELEKKPIPECHSINKYPKDCIYECGAFYQKPYREDCYFYHAEPSIGGCISCCRLHKGLGNCPCTYCNKFLSESDAFKIVLDYVNKEGKNGD